MMNQVLEMLLKTVVFEKAEYARNEKNTTMDLRSVWRFVRPRSTYWTRTKLFR